MVSPRPTNFISGLASWLTETCVKPISRASAPTLRLVIVIAVAVHEDDGDGADTVVESALKAGAGGFYVKRRLDGAVGHDPFGHLDHAFVKHLGQDDVAVEQARAGLVAQAAGRRESPWL